MMMINKKICPAGLKNNPNRPLKSVSYITIHNTGNYAESASAKSHADFQFSGSGGKQTSWHYSVDDKEIWQNFEDMRECWHAGDGNDGPGNYTSIGVEICVNNKTAFKFACNNAAWLTAELLKKHNLSLDRVVQHNKWSGKNCPAELRGGAWGIDWNGFIALVKHLYGKSPANIATYLTDCGIPTPGGKTKWRHNTVESILTNEKYKGDARLQKVFTVDFLTKTTKINEGEVPQYYVENSHPAIIAPEVFDLVQHEFKKRKAAGRGTWAGHCFTSRILCGECGGAYGSKVWHSNSQYKRTVWQCNNKYRGADICKTPHLSEEVIQGAFITAFNKLIKSRDKIIKVYDKIIGGLTDNTALEAERDNLLNECEILTGLLKRHVSENAHKALNQSEYQKQYNSLAERHSTARLRLHEIEALILERTAKRENMTRFLNTINEQADLITEFEEGLWYATVEAATVVSKEKIIITFRDGTKI